MDDSMKEIVKERIKSNELHVEATIEKIKINQWWSIN